MMKICTTDRRFLMAGISCTLPLLEITRSWGMEIMRWRGDTRAKRVSAPFTRFRVNYANMGFIGFYRPMSRPRSIVLKLMLNMAENLPSLSCARYFEGEIFFLEFQWGIKILCEKKSWKSFAIKIYLLLCNLGMFCEKKKSWLFSSYIIKLKTWFLILFYILIENRIYIFF